MMFPTPEMRAAANEAWKDTVFQGKSAEAASEAALAILPGEAVAVWRKFENGNNYLDIRDKELFASSNEIELFASTPAPLSMAVKALEWSDTRPPNDEIRYDHCVAESILGQITVEWKSWKDYPAYTVFIGDQAISIDSLEAAKAAAQSDYEARIRSALSSPVGGTEEVKELQEQLRAAKWANEHDRSTVCDQVNIIKDEIARRSWLCSSRGSYEWDDERYQQEFSAALEIIGKAVDKLSSIASDWSHCPETDAEIQAARASSPTPASDIAALREENERLKRVTVEMSAELFKTIGEMAPLPSGLPHFQFSDLHNGLRVRMPETEDAGALQHVAKGERG